MNTVIGFFIRKRAQSFEAEQRAWKSFVCAANHLSIRLSRVEDTYRVKVYLVHLIRMMLKNRRRRRRKIARGKSL